MASIPELLRRVDALQAVTGQADATVSKALGLDWRKIGQLRGNEASVTSRVLERAEALLADLERAAGLAPQGALGASGRAGGDSDAAPLRKAAS